MTYTELAAEAQRWANEFRNLARKHDCLVLALALTKENMTAYGAGGDDQVYERQAVVDILSRIRLRAAALELNVTGGGVSET